MLIAGLVTLLVAAEFLVRGAAWLALLGLLVWQWKRAMT